jgi:hypothetical protein
LLAHRLSRRGHCRRTGRLRSNRGAGESPAFMCRGGRVFQRRRGRSGRHRGCNVSGASIRSAHV